LRRSQPAVISRAYKFGAVKKSIARRALSLLPPRSRWPASHRTFQPFALASFCQFLYS
jgi:hypothetical protein